MSRTILITYGNDSKGPLSIYFQIHLMIHQTTDFLCLHAIPFERHTKGRNAGELEREGSFLTYTQFDWERISSTVYLDELYEHLRPTEQREGRAGLFANRLKHNTRDHHRS